MADTSQKSAATQIECAAVIAPGQTFDSVTEKISGIVLNPGWHPFWWFGLAVTATLVFVLLGSIFYLIGWGVGIWGIDIPVAWGFAIANFVWWIAKSGVRER